MRAFFHFRRAAFSSMLKSRVSSILTKTVSLRINLNLVGAPITSKSHTHQSYSQTSRLLTSSYTVGGIPKSRSFGVVVSCRVKRELVVYYESIKRELKIRCIYECRCDERLQTKTKEFTHLAYTGWVVELEHLEIETRLIDEEYANAMGEYVT
jgi:hypothetical protein